MFTIDFLTAQGAYGECELRLELSKGTFICENTRDALTYARRRLTSDAFANRYGKIWNLQAQGLDRVERAFPVYERHELLDLPDDAFGGSRVSKVDNGMTLWDVYHLTPELGRDETLVKIRLFPHPDQVFDNLRKAEEYARRVIVEKAFQKAFEG